jgi:cell division septal protein FtsQ
VSVPVGLSPQAGAPRKPRRLLGPRRLAPRRPWKVVFFALALTGVLAAGAWVLVGSRLLAVRSVVVTGTHLVPEAQVLDAAAIQLGTPLIRVNTAQVAARVETITQVLSAQVTRSWPDRVVITVHERTPALAVTGPGGGFDLIDPHGVVVQWVASHPFGLPLYQAASVTSLRGSLDVSAAAAVLAELPQSLRVTVLTISAPSPDQITLGLPGGVTVLWGGTDQAAAKAQELAILLRTHARYYDVSAPGTALTK